MAKTGASAAAATAGAAAGAAAATSAAATAGATAATAGKRAIIGLGSNVGDAALSIREALARIAITDGIELLATSSLYESQPAYREDQELFCNAAALLRTDLNPYELLQVLQTLENELGRVRAEVNGSRVIDLDIIDFEGVVSDDPVLLLPHPLALERDFVVTPLLEIADGHVLANGQPVTREWVEFGKVVGQWGTGHGTVGTGQSVPPGSPGGTLCPVPTVPCPVPTVPDPAPGKLSICATPIGNLGDCTQRLIEALSQADVVLAEDTRVARRLLSHLNLRTCIERCDENTIRERTAGIIERIKQGTSFAFISDAGTPGIADPGAYLVDAARDADCTLEILPGASAVITAVAASGFTTPSFYFGGFLPRKRSQTVKLLENLADLEALLVFFESPHRALASLEVIAGAFPARRVVLARELTKLHEEVLRAPAAELYEQLKEREQLGQPLKGEIVFVIEPPSRPKKSHSHQDRYANKKRKQNRSKNLSTMICR